MLGEVDKEKAESWLWKLAETGQDPELPGAAWELLLRPRQEDRWDDLCGSP